MSREINLALLVARFHEMKQGARPKDVIAVMQAMRYLRKSCLPEAYLDGLQDELIQMIGQPIPEKAQTWVYLAFHGAESRAEYMKIGVARNVRARMSGISTGNPLPMLWTYKAAFAGRHHALKVERALLGHMGPDRVKGEWVKVAGLSESASCAIVDSLAEVASESTTQPVAFVRHRD